MNKSSTTADSSFATLKTRLQQVQTNFGQALKTLPTGRAHPSMLDGVKIAVYETKLPLNQLATVMATEAKLLEVKPFDVQNITAIRDAIAGASDLGLNPTDDGRAIYIPVPPLTTERRQQINRQLQSQKEAYLVQLRQVRHAFLNNLKEAHLPEDDFHARLKQLEQLVSAAKEELEAVAKVKADEILQHS